MGMVSVPCSCDGGGGWRGVWGRYRLAPRTPRHGAGCPFGGPAPGGGPDFLALRVVGSGPHHPRQFRYACPVLLSVRCPSPGPSWFLSITLHVPPDRVNRFHRILSGTVFRMSVCVRERVPVSPGTRCPDISVPGKGREPELRRRRHRRRRARIRRIVEREVQRVGVIR